MFVAAVKTRNSIFKKYTKYQNIAGAIALSLIVWGCSQPFTVSKTQWQTYKNSRYSFEFPYPKNWHILATPENDDGIALVSPRSPKVEIRAWANNRLPDGANQIQPNFQTTQGVSGVMQIEVGQQVTAMKVTFNQDKITYHWQGQSLNQEFSNYYPLFYYIAQQYRIPQ